MQIPIPYRIRVGQHMYSVDVVQTMRRQYDVGRTYYDLKRIEISTHSNVTGKALPAAEINDTFWHETVHAILYEMGHRLHRDERFVSTFATHLANTIRSAKFK